MDSSTRVFADRARSAFTCFALATLTAGPAVAADQISLGSKLDLSLKSGEHKMKVVAKEKSTDIGAPGQAGLDPADEPDINGATVIVLLFGDTPTNETYALPPGAFGGSAAPGWQAKKNGYLYKDPKGVNGPVQLLKLFRTSGDKFQMLVKLKGTGLAIAPPNLGTEASVSATVTGGNTYCAGFGGASGGTIKKNDATRFSVKKPTADASSCPLPLCSGEMTPVALPLDPIDLIVMSDNSGSMGQENAALQAALNNGLAATLDAAAADYKVIVVSRHGDNPSESVCVEEPLSGIPAGDCVAPVPAMPVPGPRFDHYSVEVASHNGFCLLFERYTVADEFSLLPSGWSEALVPGAFKHIVYVGDDGVLCNWCSPGCVTFNDMDTVVDGESTAATFDTELQTFDPAEFSAGAARNYVFHSIVGAPPFDALDPSIPTPSGDPVTATTCPTAPDPGTGYQALSALTDGLRFSVCETADYDAMFARVGQEVIAQSRASWCEFALPPAPAGQVVDAASVVLELTPSSTGVPEVLAQVVDDVACSDDDEYYIDGTDVVLCPDTCDRVQLDPSPAMDLGYDCAYP